MLKTDLPLISVIMPTFNSIETIETAINSVLNQTYGNLEVLVVDNFSSDGTYDYIKQVKDQRLRHYQFANHGVIAASRNFAVEKSNGSLISFLDSDDWWLPNKLEEVVHIAASGFQLIGHWEFWRVGSNDTLKRYDGLPNWRPFFWLLFHKNYFSTSSITLDKDLFINSGGFNEDPEIVSAEDYDLWLRVVQQSTHSYIIPQPLGVYRIHETNFSKNLLTFFKSQFIVICRHYRNIGFFRVWLFPLLVLRVTRLVASSIRGSFRF